MPAMSFEEWLQTGIEEGYCSAPACATHDGVPNTDEEEDEWEQGGDPCQHVVRLWPRDDPGLKLA